MSDPNTVGYIGLVLVAVMMFAALYKTTDIGRRIGFPFFKCGSCGSRMTWSRQVRFAFVKVTKASEHEEKHSFMVTCHKCGKSSRKDVVFYD